MLFFLLILIELPVSPGTGRVTQVEPLTVALEPADRDSYLLGAGDILTVTVEGGSSLISVQTGLMPQAVCTVGSDGDLSVSGLGSIPVIGLSLNEAEADLAILARRYFPGMRVGLSLLQPRLIRVRASGMVQTPGVYPMYSLQRVSDLLELCGGLVFPASRRGWMYFDADSTRVDLMTDPASHAPVSDPLVRDGAVIVMDVCVDPVIILRPSAFSVQGDIASEAAQAWDVGQGMPLADLLETVGGAGSGVDLTRSVHRADGVEQQLWTGEGLAEIELHGGDTLLFADIADSVSVGGAVAHPRAIAWRPSFSVFDYVNAAGGAIPGASTGDIALYRDGERISRGGDTPGLRPEPGDVVQVPYSWVSRNKDAITLLGSIVSIVALIYSLSN